MRRKITAPLILAILAAALYGAPTALAGVIHQYTNNNDLSLADLSGASYTKIGGENFWIIGAMIATAIVFMLIDRAKEKKTKHKDG